LSEDEIGIVIGESRPERIHFVANRPIRVGDYVIVETADGPVLYMVEGFKNLSELLGGVMDYQTADEARRASARNPRDRIKVGVAKALGLVRHLVEDGRRIFPTIAPEPGTSVKPVDNDLLKRIYGSSGREWAEIGCLLRRGEGVRISINVNKVASRHLAILAATGKGKSNFLALLAKRIAERHGTMIIFDYHGEYVNMRMPGLRVTVPKVNPRLLDAEELADMIGGHERGVPPESGSRQRLHGGRPGRPRLLGGAEAGAECCCDRRRQCQRQAGGAKAPTDIG